MTLFGHWRKIDAIINIARKMHEEGFGTIKSRIEREGVEFIQLLPFMGPATSFHLAKNIGLNVVKPDRHLQRVSAAVGYENPKHLCEDISKIIGDRVSVVDLVIWRFATINPNYTDFFRL